jgi:HAD superfamily hydrolase (TIGR01509 family)
MGDVEVIQASAESVGDKVAEIGFGLEDAVSGVISQISIAQKENERAYKKYLRKTKTAFSFAYDLIKFIPEFLKKDNYKTVENIKNINEINHDFLKYLGITTLVLDVEDVLTKPLSSEIEPEIKKGFEYLKKNYGIVLFTNNWNLRPEIKKKYPEFFTLEGFYLKPGSDGFLDILRKKGLKPQNCCVVDDLNTSGIVGANVCGMYAIKTKPLTKINFFDYKGLKFFRGFDNLMYSLFG